MKNSKSIRQLKELAKRNCRATQYYRQLSFQMQRLKNEEKTLRRLSESDTKYIILEKQRRRVLHLEGYTRHLQRKINLNSI